MASPFVARALARNLTRQHRPLRSPAALPSPFARQYSPTTTPLAVILSRCAFSSSPTSRQPKDDPKDKELADAPGAGSRGPSGDLKRTISDATAEAKGITRSFKEAVSGGGGSQTVESGGAEGGIGEATQTLSNIVNLRAEVPRGAQLFGVAGLVPYLATSLTTVYLSRQAGLAGVQSTSSAANTAAEAAANLDSTTALALLHHVEIIQVSYGALILSFLGAIHWGFEFSKFGGTQGPSRFALGIFPTIIAWPTLLLPGQVALAAQWAAFTSVWFLDMKATSWGWTPRWYSTYRFYLTAIVGGSIILTLVGSTYFGPLSGGAWMTTGEKLARIGEAEEHGKTGTKTGRVDGKIETKPGKDSYVTFVDVEKKKEREEEERKQKAEEEAKKRKEEAEQRKSRAEEARDKAEGKNKDAGKSQ